MADREATRPRYQIEVSPQATLVDEPVRIRLTGLIPGEAVTIRAATQDGALKPWASHATFIADAQGCVDASSDKPVQGTYDEVDPVGLFWSMSAVDAKRPIFFTKTKATPLTITLTAVIRDSAVASCDLVRKFAAPGVTMTSLQEQGLIGTLCLPAEPGPHPAVIVLNGSDRGMHENAAALLASRGYATLALAYFGLEDLPGELVSIPLEYFERAIHWLQNHPAVMSEKIGVIGLSRGGELALLLGSMFPMLKAVIAGSPSSLVQSGIKNNMDFTVPSWTSHGEPLPHMVYKRTLLDNMSFMWGWLTRTPFSNKSVFIKGLQKRDMVEKTTIPVEKISGPVLLISGQDDQLWPSTQFCKLVMERLAGHAHPHPYIHLDYERAGHFLCFPYGLPSLPPLITLSPVAGLYIAFGGTVSANAAAATDSWQKILAFLAESLPHSSARSL
jgi:dienelactone hydrolase